MRRPRLDRTSWLLLGAFAGLGMVSGGPWGFPLAAWLAPVFGLRFMRTQPNGWRGYRLLVLAGWLAAMVATHGYFILSGGGYAIHPAVGLLIDGMFLAIVAPLAMLPYVVDRWVLGRWFVTSRPFAATLVFPLAATAFEFGGGDGPFGTFGASAYTQFEWLPVVQAVSVAGLWGLAFLMAWFAAVAAHVWEQEFDWRATARGVAAYAGVLGLVVGFGLARLWFSPGGDSEVYIAGITADADIPFADDDTYEADVAAIHAEYLARTQHAADRGARFVVWPEMSAYGPAEPVDALLAQARALAAERGIYLVVTTAVEGADETVLHVIDPQGELALTHVKYGGTDLAALFGAEQVPKELRTLETPYGTISGIVCWDADFPATVRQAGRQGVDLLFVPANDWFEVREIHAEMAVFRAVENGMSLVRQTSNGVSLATDAYGRVLSYGDTYRGVFSQDVVVPINSVGTLYPRVGDVVGWIALVVTAAMLIVTFVRGRLDRRRRRDEPIRSPAEQRQLTTTRS